MFLQLLITFFLLLTLTLYYKLWYLPKKTMTFYTSALKKLGYTVYQMPYNPFINSLRDNIKKGIDTGDAMKVYKHDFLAYDVVVANVLDSPEIIVNHPDFSREFYAVDKHYQYPKDAKIVQIFTRAIGPGLPLSEGSNWKRKRTILNKVFNFDFIKSQIPRIAEICDLSLNEMQANSKKKQGKSVWYNVNDATSLMFSGVIMKSFIGGGRSEVIDGVPAGKYLANLIGDLATQSFFAPNFLLGSRYLNIGLTSAHREINRRIRTYSNWGLNFVKKRMQEIEQKLSKNPNKNDPPSDIIEALMIAHRDAKQKNNSSQQVIATDAQIFEEFNAFFIAGTDTTATFTELMLYEIARRPDIEAKVRAQVQKYMKDDNYEYDNLKNLKYIDMLQKQVTRYHGPATHLFSRKAKQDNYLNGLPVHKGTHLSLMAISTHFSQKYFKNPTEFRPERWESECDNLPQFVAGGFSAGARTCIGKHLALLENKIALVKFLKRYEKIVIPKKEFRMTFKLLYCPEEFQTEMVRRQV